MSVTTYQPATGVNTGFTAETVQIEELIDVDSVTGTGAVVVMQTSPTIITPIIATVTGSSSASGTLILRATSHATDGTITFYSDATTIRASMLSSGEWIFGSDTSLISSELVCIRKDQNAETALRVVNHTTGTGASARVNVRTQSNGAVNLGLQANSTSYTPSGMLQAGAACVYADGASAVSLNLGCIGAVPITFWSSTTRIAHFASTPSFFFGPGYTTAYASERLGLRVDQNAATRLNIVNATAGTASTSILGVMEGTVVDAYLISYSSSFTTSGNAIAGEVQLQADGSGITGMSIRNISNTAMKFYTNDALRMTIAAGGEILIAGDLELDAAINHDGTTIGFFGVTPATRAAAYTPSNVAADRSYDANGTSTEELADVLGTLIADLQLYGLLQ